MIGRIYRGSDTYGLLHYLYGPGRNEEHADPHLIAGYADPITLDPPRDPGGGYAVGPLARRLDEYVRLLEADVRPAEHVYHVPLRTAPEDRRLSDAEWAQVATDVVARLGFARPGDPDRSVRWVAVRHGDDHVHLVVTLARPTHTVPSLHNDRLKLRQACQAAESRLGLRQTRAADGTAEPRPARAAAEKAARAGHAEPARTSLAREVRAAAAAAGDVDGFLGALRDAGVLVRPRHSETQPGEITGYAVAWPGDVTTDGNPVWHSGGRLGPDLSLPKLRRRWTGDGDGQATVRPPMQRDPARRRQILTDATAAARAAAHRAEPGDEQAAGDLAAAAARLVEGTRPGRLDQAARQLTQAGVAPYGRVTPASGGARELRRHAMLLRSLGRVAGGRETAELLALLAAIAGLAEATARLREAQGRLAQALDARAAATVLAAPTPTATPPSRPPAAASRPAAPPPPPLTPRRSR